VYGDGDGLVYGDGDGDGLVYGDGDGDGLVYTGQSRPDLP
jgi:hypothetical protein